MTITRKTIYPILLLAPLLVLFTSGTSRAAASPPLEDILKRTEEYYQQLPVFTSNFRQSTTSTAATAMTSQAEGKLTYKKPRQMRWEYEKPEKQVFVANNDLAWLHVPSENQISLFDAETFFSSPLARTFFDGVSELKNHFDVVLDFNLSTSASAVLKLVPRQEDPNFRELYLWIDMKTYRISQIESHDLLGNINRITLEPEKQVSSIDPATFQMKVSPSTIVTDMQGRQLPPAEVEMLLNKLSK